MMLTLSSGSMFFVQTKLNEHIMFPSSIALSLNISNSNIEGGFNEIDIKYAVEYITPCNLYMYMFTYTNNFSCL